MVKNPDIKQGHFSAIEKHQQMVVSTDYVNMRRYTISQFR
jgi:hypothetical protein